MKKTVAFLKKTNAAFNKHPLIFCVVASFILELVIECLAHFSIIDGFKLLIFSPIVFAINMLILTVTLATCLLFKRSTAMFTTVFCVWLGLGIANCIILLERPSPFTFSDLYVLPSVFSIITVYLAVWQVILIAVVIIAAIVGLVFFWLKAPKRERCLKKDAPNFGILVSVLFIILPFCLAFGTVPTTYSQIYHSYYQYGFPYSFTRSAFVGIAMPKGYSQGNVNNIADRIDVGQASELGKEVPTDIAPNVIYVQLESFIDVKYIKNVEFSKDPTPNFTALKESFPSGYLTVPLIGSGTANTEFEVLTGMNTDHFAPGEYPYISSLRDKTCETAAYLLAKRGYTTFAMHNHTGTFYSRSEVYPNLGFDTFVPVEYMYEIERNHLGWAKDKVLTSEILSATASTETRDFVFAVSVQPHGTYETELTEFGDIDMYGIEDEKLLREYSYYVGQLYETDAFVGELIAAYEESDEPTVIVFYGDHLPDLALTEEDIDGSNLYQTEYVIWSNYDLPVKETRKDLQSYQLSSYVFDLIGVNDGIMFGVHEYLSDSEDYDKIMHLMEYDALFGDRFAYEGREYQSTEMTYGTRKIELESYTVSGDIVTVYGSGFNASSVICVNGVPLETVFVNNGRLIADLPPDVIESGAAIFVSQIAADKTQFTHTGVLYFN